MFSPSSFLAPPGRLLSRLRFAGKFALVGTLFLIPLGLVFFYFQSEINHGIAFVQLERSGVAYERPVSRLLEDALRHQRLVSRRDVSRDVSPDDVARQEQQIGQDIQAVDAVDGRLGTALKSTGDWAKVRAQWQAVLDSGAGADADKSEAAHQAFVDALVAFIQTVGNNSNLILDPDMDSYYTMDSALTQMPQVLVGLTRAGDLAAAAARRRALTPGEGTQLTVLTGQISAPLSALGGDVQQAEQFNPLVKRPLDAPQSAAAQQTNAFLGAVQTGLLKAPRPRTDAPAITAAAEGTADALAQYQGQALDTLDTLLQNRLHGFVVRRDTVDACVAVSLLLAFYFFAALSFYTTRALAEVSGRMAMLNGTCVASLGAALQALERGDLTMPVVVGTQPLAVDTNDELGEVAATFNRMLAQTQTMIASFGVSQQSLCRLVLHLQDAAAHVGREAQTLAVTAGQARTSSGEISQSFKEIVTASEQSARGADEVARGSALQATSVAQGAELLQQLTQAVQAAAVDAQRAAQAVGAVAQAAEEGTATVGQSLTGMVGIRDTVRESAQVIGTMGEASARIGTIVSTIEDIASQTNLLALNAAIEAARVGEAGSGFAVVADEVRKLAERSRGATAEIKALVGEVQARTAEAVAAMDGGVREVEAGSALAQQAGEALAQIRRAVSAVGGSVSGILAATQEMAYTSENVSHQITDVAAVVEEASAAAGEMSASVEGVAVSLQTVMSASARQEVLVDHLVISSQEMSAVARDLEERAARFQVTRSPETSEGVPVQAPRLRRAA